MKIENCSGSGGRIGKDEPADRTVCVQNVDVIRGKRRESRSLSLSLDREDERTRCRPFDPFNLGGMHLGYLLPAT